MYPSSSGHVSGKSRGLANSRLSLDYAKPITDSTSVDHALKDVASEIRNLVSEPPPVPGKPVAELSEAHRFDVSLDLVRGQIRYYVNLYERTRQHMRPSHERTQRMEQIFEKMRNIATASFPLLDELEEFVSR